MNPNLTILPEDDPQALKCAANLLARFTNRMLNPARAPLPQERSVLYGLQRDLKTKFSPDTVDLTGGEKLLQRLWRAFYGNVTYSRYSKKWSKMGFQHDRDPTSDFRGGGLLSLQCLVYLFEKQPVIAKHMYELQSVRVSKRGEYANYPFACAGITLVKKLCEILLLCEPITGHTSYAFETSQLTYWQVAGSRNSFYELFVWSFTVLDKLWDEMGAMYMDFGTVMRIATQRITNVLLRLPGDVVPSARSFAIDEDVDDVMNSNGSSGEEKHFIYENFMTMEDSEEEEEEESKKQEIDSIMVNNRTTTTMKSNSSFGYIKEEEEEDEICNNNYSTLPSAESLLAVASSSHKPSQCVIEDLLGLENYMPSGVTTTTSQPEPFYLQNKSVKLPTPNFFEEFGLEL
jgi:hypothetical protein